MGLFFQHSIYPWTGLIPGGKESDKGRRIVFFRPLNYSGGDSDEEEPRDDYPVPQKVHHHSHWKRNQDAVNWENYLEHKIKDCNLGKRSHMQSSCTVQQQQIASTELIPVCQPARQFSSNSIGLCGLAAHERFPHFGAVLHLNVNFLTPTSRHSAYQSLSLRWQQKIPAIGCRGASGKP